MGQGQNMRCEHCGSRNHLAFDCSKRGQGWAQSPEGKAAMAADAEAEAKAYAQERQGDPFGTSALPGRQAAEPEPTFEPKPRFRGCPPICTKENLPAFQSQGESSAWCGQFDGFKMERQWQCPPPPAGCGLWHHKASPRPPSGTTSGSGREHYSIPGYVQYFRRKPSVQESRMPDLPRRETAAKPEKPKPKKTVDRKPAPKLKSGGKDLFG